MCLVTIQKEPKILEEDLVVYKIFRKKVDGTLLSPFHFTKYFPDELYSASIGILSADKDHTRYQRSYITLTDHVIGRNFCNEENPFTLKDLESVGNDFSRIFIIREGIHSFLTKELAEDHSNCDEFIYECIIPKGSRLYTNTYGLAVSNQLIVSKEV